MKIFSLNSPAAALPAALLATALTAAPSAVALPGWIAAVRFAERPTGVTSRASAAVAHPAGPVAAALALDDADATVTADGAPPEVDAEAALLATFGTAVGDWSAAAQDDEDDDDDDASASEHDVAAAWGDLAAAFGDAEVDDSGPKIGWITFEGAMTEQPDPLAWLFGSSGTTFRDVLAKFEDAADRDDISALMLHLKDFSANTAQINALNAAIDRVQEQGKKVHTFAEVYGPAELLVAAGADEIIIQENGWVSFPGLYMEEMFLADTLAMFGLKADYVQVGDYKGASEQMTRSEPSREWNENIDHLLDDMWAQMKDTLREGRGFSEQQMEEVLPELWALQADRAIELGVIDTQLDILELREHVRGQHDDAALTQDLGPDDDALAIDFNNPFAMFAMLGREPDHTPERATIAVVHISGPIMDGESAPASFMSGETVGSRTIRQALSEIEDDDLIKGVVLRIDSPGGSALASEVIWQGVRRVAEHKPVYVSVGSMAASGGYYIAVSGDRIFVDRSSIVGSIGVVGGKIVMGNLFAKLNIGVTTRTRGPRADMASSIEPWTFEQRELIRDMMTETYELFARRVVSGRRGNVEMGAIAEGRLFTGRQAVKNGMADGIADLEATIGTLAEAVGLEDGEYDVMNYPGPKSFEEMIEGMFGGGLVQSPAMWAAIASASSSGRMPLNALTMMPLSADAMGAGGLMPTLGHGSGPMGGLGGLDLHMLRTLADLVGPAAWPQVRDSLGALLQLRDEPVLLLSPRILIQRW